MNNGLATYDKPTGDTVVVYKSNDGVVQLDVQMADETVWLTQKQMAWLFDTKPQNITIHIGKIYTYTKRKSSCKRQLVRISYKFKRLSKSGLGNAMRIARLY